MSIDIVIEPRMRDLGGFTVGRVLPYAKRRTVGPFIFFDEMGPAEFPPGAGIDVRPHPHIGLATVTYLFDGEIRHRDSLGFDQVIRPGDVNWMIAGRGIVHSERTDDAPRKNGQTMHGIQSWFALPEADEETAPEFHHHPKASLPVIERPGLLMRLIAGSAFGETSPAKTFSPMFYLGVEAKAGADIPLPQEYEERALYILAGAVDIDGARHKRGSMIVFAKNAVPMIAAAEDSKLMLLGGAPIGERKIWWNLVSSSQERIEKAKADWTASAAQNFQGTVFTLPPDETEHIPLPAE
ncbi:pirin family protein [Hyphococcus sp.]|uniref:pirin family protein n=1 Tax=Hyphococcus sp. TaxID=2038636 RepID=UPI003D0CBF8B